MKSRSAIRFTALALSLLSLTGCNEAIQKFSEIFPQDERKTIVIWAGYKFDIDGESAHAFGVDNCHLSPIPLQPSETSDNTCIVIGPNTTKVLVRFHSKDTLTEEHWSVERKGKLAYLRRPNGELVYYRRDSLKKPPATSTSS